MFRIVVPTLSTEETVILPQVMLWTTNRDDCFMDQVDLVTDITGSTNLTSEKFTETDDVLTLDST